MLIIVTSGPTPGLRNHQLVLKIHPQNGRGGRVESEVWLSLFPLVMLIELPLHGLFAHPWNRRAAALVRNIPTACLEHCPFQHGEVATLGGLREGDSEVASC